MLLKNIIRFKTSVTYVGSDLKLKLEWFQIKVLSFFFHLLLFWYLWQNSLYINKYLNCLIQKVLKMT